MQASTPQIVSLTIIISTLLLLLFGGIIIRYIFLYQHKRYRHRQEVVELREAFNQTLLQSKLEIQEQTLDHIAKELHANFSHLVSLININLSEILPQGSGDMKDSIIETKSLAKQLLSELKALSASLNTDHIMHIGFVNALNNEIERLAKTRRYQVTFTKAGQEYRLRPEHEIILFRLCQEILNNIVKYAKAKSVKALLDFSPNLFTLVIEDDGIGFDVDTAIAQSADKESTGLINIRKRAKLINAGINIESVYDKGTKFTITMPIE
jgi:signal transduction histidine kinase